MQTGETVYGAVTSVETQEVDEEVHVSLRPRAEVGFNRLMLGLSLQFLPAEVGFRATVLSEAEAYLNFLEVAIHGDVHKVGVVAGADGING